MVTVKEFCVRTNGLGEQFIALILQGDLVMVQSKRSGKFYATAKSCSITSTYTEEAAALLVGRNIPGSIIKQECDAFDYTIPETGEVIELSHSWVYSPEEVSAQPATTPVPKPMERQQVSFSTNGHEAQPA